MILDVGNCRARHLFAHVERAVWKELGYPLFGWVVQNVQSETEEEDDAATGLVKKEEAATGPKAFLGGAQRWLPGPVAEPVPKKIRGTAGTLWADTEDPVEDQAAGVAVSTGPGVDEDW